jgi:hypothetical protein
LSQLLDREALAHDMVVGVGSLPRGAARWWELPLKTLRLSEAIRLPKHGLMDKLTHVHAVAPTHAEHA